MDPNQSLPQTIKADLIRSPRFARDISLAWDNIVKLYPKVDFRKYKTQKQWDEFYQAIPERVKRTIPQKSLTNPLLWLYGPVTKDPAVQKVIFELSPVKDPRATKPKAKKEHESGYYNVHPRVEGSDSSSSIKEANPAQSSPAASTPPVITQEKPSVVLTPQQTRNQNITGEVVTSTSAFTPSGPLIVNPKELTPAGPLIINPKETNPTGPIIRNSNIFTPTGSLIKSSSVFSPTSESIPFSDSNEDTQENQFDDQSPEEEPSEQNEEQPEQDTEDDNNGNDDTNDSGSDGRGSRPRSPLRRPSAGNAAKGARTAARGAMQVGRVGVTAVRSIAPLLANPWVVAAIVIGFLLLYLFTKGGDTDIPTTEDNTGSITITTVDTKVNQPVYNPDIGFDPNVLGASSTTITPVQSVLGISDKFLDFLKQGWSLFNPERKEALEKYGEKFNGSKITYEINAAYNGSASDIEVTYPIPEKGMFISASGTYQTTSGVVDGQSKITQVTWLFSKNGGQAETTPGPSTSGAPSPTGAAPTDSQTARSTIHNLGLGGSNAARIDNLVKGLRPTSPIVGQGSTVISLAKEFNVDPLMIIIFLNESQFCTDNGVVSPGGSDPDNFNCGGILWGSAQANADTARWHARAGPTAYGHTFTFVPTIQDGIGLFFDYVDNSLYKGKTIQQFYDIYNPCADSGQYGLGCGAGKADGLMEILKESVGAACTGNDCYTGGSGGSAFSSKKFTVTILPLVENDIFNSGTATMNVVGGTAAPTSATSTTPAVSQGSKQ